MRLLKEKSPEDYSDFLKANTMQNDTLSNYYQRRGSTFTINANSKMDGSSRFGNHCAGTDSPLYRLNGSHVDDNSGLYYDESSNHNCQQNSDGGVSGQKTDGEDSPVFFI